MNGKHQIENANLSVAMCCEILQNLKRDVDYEKIKKGLKKAFLPGRCQIIKKENVINNSSVVFYLDGAHTIESFEVIMNLKVIF